MDPGALECPSVAMVELLLLHLGVAAAWPPNQQENHRQLAYVGVNLAAAAAAPVAAAAAPAESPPPVQPSLLGRFVRVFTGAN